MSNSKINEVFSHDQLKMTNKVPSKVTNQTLLRWLTKVKYIDTKGLNLPCSIQ